MNTNSAPVIGILRHRIAVDGDGVTTLVAFNSCPLRCAWCLNPQSLIDDGKYKVMTPEELYEKVRIDELYFLASGGGITFGGGEPALRPQFISDFRKICGPDWHLTLETSLNVPTENIKSLLQVVNSWIIDIKDMNPNIYQSYTGRDNTLVRTNLHIIVENSRQNDCLIRIPLIPGYNVEADRKLSQAELSSMGFSKFDLFTYKAVAR